MTLDIIIRAVQSQARSAGVAAATIVLLLTSCSALNARPVEQATQVADTVCTLGLLDSPSLRETAEAKGIPLETLASLLCTIPELVDMFRAQEQARSPDPGRGVLAEAVRKGYIR